MLLKKTLNCLKQSELHLKTKLSDINLELLLKARIAEITSELHCKTNKKMYKLRIALKKSQ